MKLETQLVRGPAPCIDGIPDTGVMSEYRARGVTTGMYPFTTEWSDPFHARAVQAAALETVELPEFHEIQVIEQDSQAYLIGWRRLPSWGERVPITMAMFPINGQEVSIPHWT